MASTGLEIQLKTSKLFSSFFTQEFLSEFIKGQNESHSIDSSLMISMLKADSKALQLPFQDFATQFVIQLLNNLTDESISSSQGNIFYQTISVLVKEEQVFLTDIREKITKYPNLIPLHVALQLDRISVMSLTYYLERCAQCPEKTSQLNINLLKLASNAAEDATSKLLFHTVCASIIYLGYNTLPTDVQEMNGQARKMSIMVLNNLTKNVWKFLMENPEKNLYSCVYAVPLKLESSLCFHLPTFQKCLLEQLAFLISYKPEVKATLAISSQHEWTYFKSSKNIVDFITQLLQPLEVEIVVAKLDDILTRYEINWKTLLLVVSTIQICNFKGHKVLKSLVSSLVQRALDNLQKELLLASFLLARQINAENTNTSQYGGWFSSITTFSTSSKHFAFLIKFLTSIVRYEPLWVLSAHKNHPPTIPVVDNCRTLWLDYSSLIRTRIEDLKDKQPLEQIVEEDIALTKEVDSAIAAYEKSGKIPSVVIEAAIFRKPYFVGKFLPVLLKARVVPDPPDIREDFVDELKSSGKLPIAQYEAYCIACKDMQKNQPVLDDPMDQTTDENQNYSNLFTQIAICKDIEEQAKLLERFDDLLCKLFPLSEQSSQTVEINLQKLENEKNEVASKVIQCWIETVGSYFSSEKPLLDGLNRCFLSIFRHPTLVESLNDLVWRFTQNGRSNSEEHLIQSYGAVVCMLCIHQNLLTLVRYGNYSGNIIDLVMKDEYFNINGAEWMLFRLKFYYYVLITAKEMVELNRVSAPTSLYLWLSYRVLHSQKARENQKYLSFSMDNQFLRETKVPLRDWLRLEMVIDPDKDILSWSERSGYLHLVLKTNYPDVPAPEMSLLIFDALIKQMTRNPSARADGSAKDFLLLLQSISTTSNKQTNGSESPAWLTKYCSQLPRKNERADGMDQLLWSHICFLPPFLLVRNSFDQPISEGSLKILLKLMEDEWRNTITCGCCWFPKHVTYHLLRALEQLPSIPDVPCLQFAAQVHQLNALNDTPLDAWRILDRALDFFNPSTYDPALQTFRWSDILEINLVVNQLMALATSIYCVEKANFQWPLFIEKLGTQICSNPAFLKGWHISSWIGNDSLLPWQKILPSYFINLLPFVLAQVLITWSPLLIDRDSRAAVNYLDALISAHNHWIETTDIFIDILTEKDEKNQMDYPAGKIMDLDSLSRMGRSIKKILNQTPIHTLKLFQQSPCFNSMESNFQMLVKQRC